MSPLSLSIVLGLTAAAANVLGGFSLVQRKWSRRWLSYFVALGSGFMLATALVEMLPESIELAPKSAPLIALGGYVLVHFFEHAVVPHFHFGEETHPEEFIHSHKAFSVLIALLVHTFFDGIAIASGFLISNQLGWIIFAAILLHKIPEGFTVASVILASGGTRARAVFSAVLLGAATIAGVLMMALTKNWVQYGLPLSAGVTLYVAATDLIPESNREKGLTMAYVVLAGMILMVALKTVLPF
jgi:ZIP family zinc transporter/zinc and cadmium transporter